MTRFKPCGNNFPKLDLRNQSQQRQLRAKRHTSGPHDYIWLSALTNTIFFNETGRCELGKMSWQIKTCLEERLPLVLLWHRLFFLTQIAWYCTLFIRCGLEFIVDWTQSKPDQWWKSSQVFRLIVIQSHYVFIINNCYGGSTTTNAFLMGHMKLPWQFHYSNDWVVYSPKQTSVSPNAYWLIHMQHHRLIQILPMTLALPASGRAYSVSAPMHMQAQDSPQCSRNEGHFMSWLLASLNECLCQIFSLLVFLVLFYSVWQLAYAMARRLPPSFSSTPRRPCLQAHKVGGGSGQ